VCEREDANCTRAAGNRDEVEGVVANTLNLSRSGAVGFIDWLGVVIVNSVRHLPTLGIQTKTQKRSLDQNCEGPLNPQQG